VDKNGAVGSGVDRRLRKSVSHYTPTTVNSKSGANTVDDPRGLREGERGGRSSLNNSGGDSTSSSTTNSNRVLKKSQSLNSVSSTLIEESRLGKRYRDKESDKERKRQTG
jgi:hypothetical protein